MEKFSRMDKERNLTPYYLLIVLIIFLYFFPRFGFRQSVFFDFDMPRVALVVQDFLKSGTFLTSQYYMRESCWLNVPWGPSLVFFYAFFLKISSDPLIVANLLSIFHFLGVGLIIILGWKYFSPTVGVIAGLLLATNPYWFTYSRIIYQPAPVITFIVISMYLLMSAVKDRNRISFVLLPVSWSVLIQMYLPTYSFIFVSILFLVFNYKTVRYKYIFFGIFLSLILFIPTIKFYIENPIYVQRFLEAPTRFTPPEKTIIERFVKVLFSFLQIPIGGKFQWQTGYAYSDLMIYFPIIKQISIILSIIFTLSLVLLKMNKYKLLILLWSLCPLFSLMLLWVTDLVPRYFLISIPPAMIMIALQIDCLITKFKKSKFMIYFFLLIPISVSIYWTVFNIKYDFFVRDYSYPSGRMYDVAETPYILFKKAMDWIDRDAKINSCQKYLISNDINDLNYSMWLETKYVWEYLYNYDYVRVGNNTNCSYLLVYEYVAKDLKIDNYRKFGPFVAFRYIKN